MPVATYSTLIDSLESAHTISTWGFNLASQRLNKSQRIDQPFLSHKPLASPCSSAELLASVSELRAGASLCERSEQASFSEHQASNLKYLSDLVIATVKRSRDESHKEACMLSSSASLSHLAVHPQVSGGLSSSEEANNKRPTR